MNMTPWQLPMNPSQFPSRDPIALSADLDLRIIEDRFVFWDRITVTKSVGAGGWWPNGYGRRSPLDSRIRPDAGRHAC